MANSDEFPELYFEDSSGNMPWDYQGWGSDMGGYWTLREWNSHGRIIKKGEKYIEAEGIVRRLFSVGQTVPYDIFYISKKNGKFRRIFSLYKEQKSRSRALIPYLEKILLKKDLYKVNYGFIRNRNCVEHAIQHIGYEYTISMDLENFFESVNKEHVSKYLNEETIEKCFILDAPQQGIPTSPLIANLAFIDCDKEIINTLEKNNIFSVYTRYADDLVVSFDNKKDIRKIISLITKIVNSAGFKINKKKTKIQNIKNGRVVITGVSIDKKGAHPTRKTIKKIRAAKHSQNKKSLMGLNEWAKCKLPDQNRKKIRELRDKELFKRELRQVERVKNEKIKKDNEFVDDIPFLDDKYTEWYENGQLDIYGKTQKKSEGYCLNDLKHGKWTTWFENGNISTQGSYIYDKKDGKWLEYSMDGRLTSTMYWKDGVKLDDDDLCDFPF